MREVVLYGGVVGFCTGIFLTSVFGSVLDEWFLVLLGAALLVITLRQPSKQRLTPMIFLAVFILATAGGVVRTEQYEANLPVVDESQVGQTVTIEGVVSKEPDEREQHVQLFVTNESQEILVSIDRYQKVAYGDLVQVTGTLSKPTSFETDLGRTFDYPGYLKAKGVTHVIRYAELTVIESNQGDPLIARLLALKSFVLSQIETNLPEPHAGLAQGLLLGVKRALGEDLEQIFRSTGIIHIVVLSGYNIMLVVAFVLYVLSFVLPWRGRLIVGMLAIIAFALMVGLSATVLRASLMAALALIARSFGRTYTVVRALLLAGAVMLLINPYLLVFDTGFQLSFLATLGLIVVSPYLEQRLQLVPTFVGVREFLVATLATQLFVLPILLYQIGEFLVVSVFVNVLVLPMVPIAMLSTFVIVIVGAFFPLGPALLSWVAYGALAYIIAIPSFFAQLPFASFVVPEFPFYVVVLAYMLSGWILWQLQRVKESEVLSGWTIEEESGSGQPPQKPAADIPVFFR